MRRHRNPRASVSKRPTPDNHGAPNTGTRPPRTSAEFDGHVDELREALGRVDALTDALKRSFDERHNDGADLDIVDRPRPPRAGDALGSEDADERS